VRGAPAAAAACCCIARSAVHVDRIEKQRQGEGSREEMLECPAQSSALVGQVPTGEQQIFLLLFLLISTEETNKVLS